VYSNPGATHKQALDRLVDIPDDAKAIERNPQAVVIDRSKLSSLRVERVEDEKHSG
jgi:2-C-methyl-D-erythritol 4-phosphate cytidylyltransferase